MFLRTQANSSADTARNGVAPGIRWTPKIPSNNPSGTQDRKGLSKLKAYFQDPSLYSPTVRTTDKPQSWNWEKKTKIPKNRRTEGSKVSKKTFIEIKNKNIGILLILQTFIIPYQNQGNQCKEHKDLTNYLPTYLPYL